MHRDMYVCFYVCMSFSVEICMIYMICIICMICMSYVFLSFYVVHSVLRFPLSTFFLPPFCMQYAICIDELIRFLLQSYPGSAKLKDGFGNLPLHLAVQFQASPSVVSLVLGAFPEALGMFNAGGGLPLHKAAQFNSPMEVLRLIIDSDGSAASKRDDRGNLPLHLLFLFCAGPPSEERLRYIYTHTYIPIGIPIYTYKYLYTLISYSPTVFYLNHLPTYLPITQSDDPVKPSRPRRAQQRRRHPLYDDEQTPEPLREGLPITW
jgi:hypothetical protein